MDKINLFAVCENAIFISLIESQFNKSNIYVSGICTQPNHAIRIYQKCLPIPDLVLLDAYWPNDEDKILLGEFLTINARVILVTPFFAPEILDYSSPLEPHGYFYQEYNNYNNIIDCVKIVAKNKGCWIF